LAGEGLEGAGAMQRPVLEWTASDVANWLASEDQGLPQWVADRFKRAG